MPSRPTMHPLWMNVFYEWMFFLWINDSMHELFNVCYFYWVGITFLWKKSKIPWFLRMCYPTNRQTDRQTDTACYRDARTHLKKWFRTVRALSQRWKNPMVWWIQIIFECLNNCTESTDLNFSLDSLCLKKSASQLRLSINRCHVCCFQQKISV